MGRKFKIIRNYWEKDEILYRKANIEINPGVTVLVGCNGSGKSTLITQLKSLLDKEKITYTSFNNLLDGGENARSWAGFCGNFPFLATAVMSSEGENIVMNIGNYAVKIRKAVDLAESKENKEVWIFFDAADSGLSIDGIKEVKTKLLNLVQDDCKAKGVEVYIIISTNAYEFANGEQCFDVYNCKYRTFKDYDEYSKFICKSKEIKNRRYKTGQKGE